MFKYLKALFYLPRRVDAVASVVASNEVCNDQDIELLEERVDDVETEVEDLRMQVAALLKRVRDLEVKENGDE